MSQEDLETIQKKNGISVDQKHVKVPDRGLNGSGKSGPTEPDGGELNIKLVTDTRSLDAFRGQWDELVDIADTYFYQTFDWNRLWWKHFGGGRELHVILLFHDDRLVGIAPLFRDTIRLRGREVDACLRFIGSTVSQPEGEELIGLLPYSDYLDFIVRPGYGKAVFEKLLPYFGQSDPAFSRIVLDELPESSLVWKHLIPALEEEGFEFRVKEASTCPIVRIPGTWEEYLDSLSKSSRYQARRDVKLAQKESHKIFEVYDAGEEELMETYDEFVRLHQQRWNHIGFPGTFGEERMYAFMRDVVRKSFPRNRLSLKKAVPVREPSDTAAVDLIFRYKDRVYLMHRALDDESPWIDESPGNVLLNVALKNAANSGRKIFDFLRGTEHFKFRTANDRMVNRTVTIESRGGSGRFRGRLARKYIRIRRRIYVEKKKLDLFLNHRTEKGGISGYLSLLMHRLRRLRRD